MHNLNILSVTHKPVYLLNQISLTPEAQSVVISQLRKN